MKIVTDSGAVLDVNDADMAKEITEYTGWRADGAAEAPKRKAPDKSQD